jgi:hypothetical protein
MSVFYLQAFSMRCWAPARRINDRLPDAVFLVLLLRPRAIDRDISQWFLQWALVLTLSIGYFCGELLIDCEAVSGCFHESMIISELPGRSSFSLV